MAELQPDALTSVHYDDATMCANQKNSVSGHTAASTVFYGALAAYLVCHLKPWRWRIAAVTVAMAAMMVVLVGLSRMYLGVHYLSDVL
ncbi:MAG: phosphatase PAP2 family protein, partial [Oxalobacteraceae bacterium]